MAKKEKTNVQRLLDQKKIPYESFEYPEEITEGVVVAKTLNQAPERVFKTLVTESDKKEHFVFVIPVAETLDLKAAARVVGVKALSMLKQKELLPLTGYVHGGCSPIGMKKPFKTVINISASQFEAICVSAGRLGKQIKLSPTALCEFVGAEFAEVVVS